MKKLILATLLAVCVGNFSFAQCKETSDPFTNEKMNTYKWKKKVVYYECKSKKTTLEMMFMYAGALNAIISQGAELTFKTANGDVVKCQTISDAAPKVAVAGSVIYTNFSFIMAVSKEDLEKLSASKVVLVRYPDGKGGITDLKLKKGAANAVMQGATCVKAGM